MTNEIVEISEPRKLPETIEKVVITGDLMPLRPEERIIYYHHVCESLGLNPLTNPFAYIIMNGKLTLYARKECTEQLRKNHRLSVQISARERLPGDIYVVTARAIGPDGRFDESTGAVHLSKLQGDALANALMKAETKAKRRVTLSFCGLGFVDESEVSSIKGAIQVDYDYVPPPVKQPKEITSQSIEPIDRSSLFDCENPEHVTKLEALLKGRNIAADMWEAVFAEMQGKFMGLKVFEETLLKLGIK